MYFSNAYTISKWAFWTYVLARPGYMHVFNILISPILHPYPIDIFLLLQCCSLTDRYLLGCKTLILVCNFKFTHLHPPLRLHLYNGFTTSGERTKYNAGWHFWVSNCCQLSVCCLCNLQYALHTSSWLRRIPHYTVSLVFRITYK